MTRHLATDVEVNALALNRCLRLFNTGMKHDAKEVLEKNHRPEQEVLIQQAQDAIRALEGDDYDALTVCINYQWFSKYGAAPTDEHCIVSKQMQKLGFPGMKLIGAGDGGCILAIDPTNEYMPWESDFDTQEILFDIDPWGSQIIYGGEEF
jgi:galactokinase/mevalonate kinase-like predicted kinase